MPCEKVLASMVVYTDLVTLPEQRSQLVIKMFDTQLNEPTNQN